MTKRQFVVLVFRLFALYLLFNLINNLSGLIGMLNLPGGSVIYTLTILYGAAILLFVISLLWRKSEWLMQKIFAIPALSGKTMEVEAISVMTSNVEDVAAAFPNSFEVMDYYETPISIESIQLIALSTLGLWVAFNNLTPLVTQLGFVIRWSSERNDSILSLYTERNIMSLVADIIEVALGVWLFLRPWQFQGWIEKFKPKGDADAGVAN